MSPLAGDTASMLDLPPVRMGLLTKLNLLTIGLIFLTAVAITAFHFAQQWRDEEQQLRSQGDDARAMHDRARGIRASYTADKAALEQMLDGMSGGPRHRLRRACSTRSATLVERRFAAALANARLPPTRGCQRVARPRRVADREIVIDGQRYIELIAAIDQCRHVPGALHGSTAAPPDGDRGRRAHRLRAPRPDATNRSAAQFREQMLGAIGVVLAAGRRRCRRDADADAPAGGADAAADARGARRGRRAPRRLRAGAARPTSWACSRTRSTT